MDFKARFCPGVYMLYYLCSVDSSFSPVSVTLANLNLRIASMAAYPFTHMLFKQLNIPETGILVNRAIN